jgi:hypothetical protein
LGRSAAYASIRFSLGRFTTPGEIENAITIVNESLKIVRESAYPSFQSLRDNASSEMEWAHPGLGDTPVF